MYCLWENEIRIVEKCRACSHLWNRMWYARLCTPSLKVFPQFVGPSSCLQKDIRELCSGMVFGSVRERRLDLGATAWRMGTWSEWRKHQFPTLQPWMPLCQVALLSGAGTRGSQLPGLGFLQLPCKSKSLAFDFQVTFQSVYSGYHFCFPWSLYGGFS